MVKTCKKPNCPVCRKGRMRFAKPDYPKNGRKEG
jgi:hypothetical protein